MHKIIVYQATNKVNGKRYIGITRRGIEVRKRRHFHTAASGKGAYFAAAIRKYGKDAFEFRVLIVCPNFDYAGEMERAAIALYQPEYNLTAGGGGVLDYKLSEEARAKISASQKGNKHWLGKAHSADTIKRMKEARTKFWEGRPHTRKSYLKNAPKRGCQIKDTQTGVIYESIMHAARANGLTRENIRSVLRGRGGAVLAGKFVYCVQTEAIMGLASGHQRDIYV